MKKALWIVTIIISALVIVRVGQMVVDVIRKNCVTRYIETEI
jgi:hypothetical protein